MPLFDIMGHLIRPIYERMSQDGRFQGINIVYDRSDDEIVTHAMMPCINYFLDSGWEDELRGSNTASLRDRRVTALIGFGVWAMDTNRERLDSALFMMTGSLIDFLRENTDFDRTNGVFLASPIRWTPVAAFGDENNILGTQRIGCTFELYSGQGV